MQGGYGGGVYPAPPIPPDYPSLYGGSSTTSYGGSAPSAPAYTPAAPPAAPAYHQPVPSSNSSPASGAYNSQFAPEYNQSYNSPSNSYVPSMPNPDASNNQPSYSNSYPPSYAPAVPSYPAVVPAYDRSFEFGLGSAPTSTSFDSSAPSQRSNYGNASFGAAPQPVGPPAGYESYSNQGLGGYSQSGDGDSGRFDMYGHPTGYGRSESVHPSNGGGSDRSYDNGGFRAVYAYDGGGVEPYGARGSGGDSWSSSGSSYNFQNEFSSSKPYNVARAAPKSDEDSDSGGIQKFRVKLLPETRSSDSVKDVICQIGLDGVRMVDPSTNRTLRIYPLVTITRWERHEMVKDEATDSGTSGGGSVGNDPNTAKKSSVLDWVALRPRAANPEEKQHWVPDELVTKCTSCDTDFGAFLRRAEITQRMENPKPNNAKLPALRTHEDLAKKLQEELERNNAGRKPALGRSSSSGAASSGQSTSVVNCSKCGSITLVTGRSTRCSNCETSTRSAAPARRSPGFSGSAAPHGPPHLWATNTPASDGPGPRMREVACPTCTVHLQVQVPSFGTETVECGVCQHPFLVAA
ncbi:hypothetical protein AXG93_2587s1740 [Marchantia polymorpha subsp. ruderalis]|uniref:Uncharacterized protein n=1 Tax=Marchantia polymorpha subsp. ruderalis TaxID=1480154 RepID=A0A176WQQ0_MARPO|nr:hypothetical protein AXG93_2587s1740 [Marchantia polymorpha subsp. ruderalis]